MRRPDPAKAFQLAWRVVGRMPRSLARGIFDVIALVAHTARIGGVRQLESNLARVRPEADARELRRLSRAGMRSYMRYYCESFQLPSMSETERDARVRAIGAERVRDHVLAGGSVVMALGHAGNWDLAGAWAQQHVGRVVTVAEKLEPEELFREFLAFREGLGMVIVPYERGSGVFRRLISEARDPAIIPLLADRDLSRSGVEVLLGDVPIRVAPGPAALAIASRSALSPVFIHYERLRGERRRKARSPWGIVIEFCEFVETSDGPAPVGSGGAAREQRTQALTQRWFDVWAARVREHPEDWHMLQKVFTADLDPERLARAAAEPAS
ncbi:phosphatidylinositol mannoside acyltransferase [Occultella glacieicola]|uniref:Phosphatidylinositol mannoside acyltransferase n=1 Tax=Occultella glacieicola TaxID=2518684 RepID=A0ABY2E3L3_9MICO|nr:phosphatidylinositol mannoside acyltransferase [Occultella glacieicola]TDE92453.1 phosphatidylinositol mannoside acyltransferase [Occultella glacieicola]